MISLGVDIGAENTRVVILRDGSDILARARVTTGFNQKDAAEAAIEQALKMAGITRNDIGHITVTGVGRKTLGDHAKEITVVPAAARGAHWLFPSAKTVIDIGAEDARAAKLDANGNIKDFAVNEKCAAGAGTFIRAMARALECPIEDFATMSLRSQKHIPMNAQCVIFAESEVVSLIHSEVDKADIAKAVHDSMAERIFGMAGRVGIERDVVVVGGVARNPGFIASLKEITGVDILVPEQPDYVAALGAALTTE